MSGIRRCVVQFGEPTTGNVRSRFPFEAIILRDRDCLHRALVLCPQTFALLPRTVSRLASGFRHSHSRRWYPDAALVNIEPTAINAKGANITTGGRKAVHGAGAPVRRLVSVASAAVVLAISAVVDSRFPTSASVQPEFEECDRTPQVHDAIVALADAMAYSNA